MKAKIFCLFFLIVLEFIVCPQNGWTQDLSLIHISLSVAFGYDKLDNLSQFDIPRNEIPIVIIGARCV